MKKIVYVVYHDINKEARSMELLKCCKLLGELNVVTYAIPKGIKDINTYIINKDKTFALFNFLKTAKKVIKNIQPDIVVLHDNDCSVLIPYIKRKLPRAKIIYDSSELYITIEDKRLEEKENRTYFENGFFVWLKQKLTSFRKSYEKRYLNRCDVVIAANDERAVIMKDFFKLNRLPIIFDNMHKIEDEIDFMDCNRRFQGIIKDNNHFNIVFAGGISPERKTIEYIKSVMSLGKRYNLIIAGSATQKAKKEFKQVKSRDVNNQIHYVGFISRAELRYLFKMCQASVIIFDKYSLNTLYCASGKLYESIFEFTPILTSENPPLRRLCEVNNIGVSNDNYGDGILMLDQNYDVYKKSLFDYVKKLKYEDRIESLKNMILKNLES